MQWQSKADAKGGRPSGVGPKFHLESKSFRFMYFLSIPNQRTFQTYPSRVPAATDRRKHSGPFNHDSMAGHSEASRAGGRLFDRDDGGVAENAGILNAGFENTIHGRASLIGVSARLQGPRVGVESTDIPPLRRFHLRDAQSLFRLAGVVDVVENQFTIRVISGVHS